VSSIFLPTSILASPWLLLTLRVGDFAGIRQRQTFASPVDGAGTLLALDRPAEKTRLVAKWSLTVKLIGNARDPCLSPSVHCTSCTTPDRRRDPSVGVISRHTPYSALPNTPISIVLLCDRVPNTVFCRKGRGRRRNISPRVAGSNLAAPTMSSIRSGFGSRAKSGGGIGLRAD
jgi:hypothetical protein